MNRFKLHPSGILIGKTYKIKGWKPRLFKTVIKEQRIEVLRTWNKTQERIEEELLEAVL